MGCVQKVNTSLTQELECLKRGTRLTLDFKYGVFIRLIGVIFLLLMSNAVLLLLIFPIILFGYPLIIWKFGTLNKSILMFNR